MAQSNSSPSPPDLLPQVLPETVGVPREQSLSLVEKLESLKLAFSGQLRKSRASPSHNNRIFAGSLSSVADDVVLRGGLDTLERLLDGISEESTTHKFCAAYIALAMATEIRGSITEDFYTNLLGDFERFVESEGDSGLTWRFFNVAGLYLKGLKPSSPGVESSSHGAEEETTRLRMRANFETMKAYLHSNPFPRLLPSQQDSRTSTAASTIADHEVVPETLRQPGRLQTQTESYDTMDNNTSADNNCLASVGVTPTQPETNPKNRTIAAEEAPTTEISCRPCGYYAAPGPRAANLLYRHLQTPKHHRIKQRLEAEGAGHSSSSASASMPQDGATLSSSSSSSTAPVETTGTPSVSATSPPLPLPRAGEPEPEPQPQTFYCPLLRQDGTPCGTTFSRRDNLRNHMRKIKHRVVDDGNDESMAYGDGDTPGYMHQNNNPSGGGVSYD